MAHLHDQELCIAIMNANLQQWLTHIASLGTDLAYQSSISKAYESMHVCTP